MRQMKVTTKKNVEIHLIVHKFCLPTRNSIEGLNSNSKKKGWKKGGNRDGNW